MASSRGLCVLMSMSCSSVLRKVQGSSAEKEQEPNEAKTSLACDDRTTIFHHAPQFLRF
jgi:hypothetical protein